MQLRTFCSNLSKWKSRPLAGILLLTTIVAIALPLINAKVIYPAFTDIITSAIEEDAQRLAAHTIPPSIKYSELTHEMLDSPFFAAIYKLENDFGLMKIKVFSSNGEVLYSTEPTEIGHLNTKPYFKEVVTKGLPYTKLVSKNTKTLEGEVITSDVVETYVPLMNNDRFLGSFELYYDITKRKERMEQFATYSTAAMSLLSLCLLTVVAVLIRKETARAAAQDEASALKDEVERITRHDLKSPIIGLLNGIEYLENFTTLDKEQADITSDMRITANTGMNMINRSLDLYRMETGNYRYDPATMDMLAVSRRVAADLAGLATPKGINVLITKAGNIPNESDSVCVTAEETLCYSLISNLLKNSIEASETGERVTLTLNENENISITIHNNGVVPEEIRETFFDKYTTAGKKSGTGLGTYSAKLMAKTMGGSIEMDTSEEDGTKVTVVLPKSTTEEA